MRESNKLIAVIFTVVALTALSGCAKDYGSNIEPRAEVNRTYEKIVPAPAVIATSYDISMKLDTQDDRLYEQVGIDILNDTDEAVDTVYLRYYPMGYVGYLTEARSNSAEANKNKKAEVQSVRLEGTGKELPEDYTAASAGTITAQNGITSIKLKNIPDLAMAVSNFMDVETFEAQGTTVRNFYLKAVKEEAYRAVSKQTVLDAFDFYTKLLGQYSRDEFTMVQGVAGMEHSGLAFVNGLSYLNNQNDDMNGLQRNIAHELGHSWFYDSVRNNEFREGWIDEGITSYLASDELLYQDLESYKTEKQYGADGSREVYTNARNEVRSKSEADFLKGLDHCYLNEPWDVVPEGSNAGSKEYSYAPIFLYHAKEIMGEEAFYGFLSEVYRTYTNKVVHSEEILKILRSHNDSKEMNDLIAFYFKEN